MQLYTPRCHLRFGFMMFILKKYKPLPRRICQLWLDIQDIIGPVKKWPPKMRNLFFTGCLTHYERLKVCAFVCQRS